MPAYLNRHTTMRSAVRLLDTLYGLGRLMVWARAEAAKLPFTSPEHAGR